MTLSLATVGAKITAAFMNLIIGQVNAQGLTGVVPTSVAGTGVSVGASGKVTVTAATSASINGCFTSTYDKYLIVMSLTGSSTGALTYRMRLAGTDNSAAQYGVQIVQGSSSTAAAAAATAGTSGQLSPGVSTTGLRIDLDVWEPALAVNTFVMSKFIAITSTSAMIVGLEGGQHNVATAYDGITFIPTSGTLTGSIRVYGYNTLV